MHLQGQLIGEMYSDAMDIKPSTPLISWSLAKSVTSAIVGVRSVDSTIETAFDPYQLATTPVWNTSEVAARNITGETCPALPCSMVVSRGACMQPLACGPILLEPCKEHCRQQPQSGCVWPHHRWQRVGEAE